MKRMVESKQRKVEVLGLRVDGTGTASIEEGARFATLTDNGTGDYTLTWTDPFAREPIVVVCPEESSGNALTAVLKTNTATAVNIIITDDADADTDAVFHVIVYGFSVSEDY